MITPFEDFYDPGINALFHHDTLLIHSFKKLCAGLLSHVQLFVAPWTVACQAPASIKFSRHEYWSGFLFPSSGNLPDPGTEPMSLAMQADSLPFEKELL